MTDDNNPSGSEYTLIPSSDIPTSTQIDYSEVFTVTDKIDPDNPDEYLKSQTNIHSYFIY